MTMMRLSLIKLINPILFHKLSSGVLQDTPNPVILTPTHVSGANSNYYAALPGKPYLFSKMQSDPEILPPRRFSRIKDAQQHSPMVIQSHVKDNKGRSRSLRHANRFTCLPYDDDDSSIHSGVSVDSSPTDQFDKNIFNPAAAIDVFQPYRNFLEISPKLPCPVSINDHNSYLLLLSVDNSNPYLPSSSISCPISSEIPTALPAPPQNTRNCSYRTHISQYIDFTNSDYISPSFI